MTLKPTRRRKPPMLEKIITLHFDTARFKRVDIAQDWSLGAVHYSRMEYQTRNLLFVSERVRSDEYESRQMFLMEQIIQNVTVYLRRIAGSAV